MTGDGKVRKRDFPWRSSLEREKVLPRSKFRRETYVEEPLPSATSDSHIVLRIAIMQMFDMQNSVCYSNTCYLNDETEQGVGPSFSFFSFWNIAPDFEGFDVCARVGNIFIQPLDSSIVELSNVYHFWVVRHRGQFEPQMQFQRCPDYISVMTTDHDTSCESGRGQFLCELRR